MATIKPNGDPVWSAHNVITDVNLKAMEHRAARVWRGETLPKSQCAADVLYLVNEVRALRALLVMKTGKTVEESAVEEACSGFSADNCTDTQEDASVVTSNPKLTPKSKLKWATLAGLTSAVLLRGKDRL